MHTFVFIVISFLVLFGSAVFPGICVRAVFKASEDFGDCPDRAVFAWVGGFLVSAGIMVSVFFLIPYLWRIFF